MKVLPDGMQTHLESAATTLCTCWKLSLADGRVFGFTDHDRHLEFDNVAFEPAAGFTASAIETGLGLNVDNLEVLGALHSDRLTESDLAAGRIDNAGIEIWRVNWTEIAQRVLLRKGNLGEISRGQTAFVAEVRGLAHLLNQSTGRLYQRTCDVDLGSARCGIDLQAATYKGSGTVLSVENNRKFNASGLDSFPTDWFSAGRLLWRSGANTDLAIEIKAHGNNDAVAALELWQAMSSGIQVGDTFEATAGCDKAFSTCKEKFSNALNFRGTPHMPGNDFVLSYPTRGLTNSGGSLVGNG